MSAMKPFCNVVGLKFNKFSKEEFFILEIELFARVCEELNKIFKIIYEDYFNLMKFNEMEEQVMMENNFVSYLINDILLTEEYSLQGIACYTHTPEEVIDDLVSGRNISPSLQLSRRIIDLHRSVRPDLYRDIMKKITTESLSPS